jgi:hypothetical protein
MDQVVIVSSNANNGTNAGTFIVNANNDSSNRNRNIGTHLAVSSVREISPFPFWENMSIQYSLVGKPNSWENNSK